MRWMILFGILGAPCLAVEYNIYRAPSKIVIDGKLDEPAWREAPPVSDFIFNWFSSGEKEPTVAKMLWDDDNLYVSWRCTDAHISAYETKKNGPVSKDDCVEIFISPHPEKIRNYYTFEINAIGTMLNRCRTEWWTGGPFWEPAGVSYRTSFHGLAKKDESADDKQWAVELAIPLKNFAKDAPHTPPQDGDAWHLNLMRTGGKTNMQQSTWSPIPAASHSFHTPENFGKVIFLSQTPPARRAGGRGGRDGQGRPSPPDPEAAKAGRGLYNSSCTSCHGLDGDAGDRAPALGEQRRYLRRTESDIYDAIKNGIKGTLMPASPMAEGDIRKIIAFILSLRATAIDFPSAGEVAKGEAVFHGKGGCTKCHMLNGRGGLTGPDLSNIAAERKLEDLKIALTRKRPNIPRGYLPVTVTLTSGGKIRGMVKNQHNSSLQILGLDGKLYLPLSEEIANVQYEEQSLMPFDFDKKLSADEFKDLMAFLSRQARARERQ